MSNPRCSLCGAAFTLSDGVVVLDPAGADRDYPEALVDLVASVEHRHFWFAARNHVILSTMRREIGPLDRLRVLDVGCGTGFVLAALEEAGMNGCGIDMHRAALTRARARVRGPLVQSSAAGLPFFQDFDVLTLCDVIEHLDDEIGILEEARRMLVPGGSLVVTVPAGPALWTAYDEVIGHKRRYDRALVSSVLARAGFEVCYVGYFNCLGVLVQAAQRRIATQSERKPGDAIEIVRRALRVPPEPVNSLLGLLVRLEAPLRRLDWIGGGSIVAVARSPVRPTVPSP